MFVKYKWQAMDKLARLGQVATIAFGLYIFPPRVLACTSRDSE